jgi:hypothetical protein
MIPPRPLGTTAEIRQKLVNSLTDWLSANSSLLGEAQEGSGESFFQQFFRSQTGPLWIGFAQGEE